MRREPQNTDKYLVRKLKHGNKDAFETLFNRYKIKIYQFSLRYLKSPAEAEEILQNTFVSLWEHRYSLDESQPIKSYLFKIAVNNIYNLFRHNLVKNKYELYVKNGLDTANEGSVSLETEELRHSISKHINELPHRQREVFCLSRWEGLSHSEIAKRLGLSVRSVENQIYRAMKYIRAKLQEEKLI